MLTTHPTMSLIPTQRTISNINKEEQTVPYPPKGINLEPLVLDVSLSTLTLASWLLVQRGLMPIASFWAGWEALPHLPRGVH